ncbi:MAG: 2,3-bisphosphoglycerate-independent phosphoglycerate mutase [Candidatus Bathyarchaeia archaeon]
MHGLSIHLSVAMKILLIIGDGMADRPLKELGGLTPLEAANACSMDRLASMGVSGLFNALGSGVAPGSDVACLSILGYDPYKVYTGRGGFEAAGADINMKDGDLAFRCNFATVNDDMTIIDARAGRIGEEAVKLAESLQNLRLKNFDVEVVFRHTLGHKGAMVLRGCGLSPKVDIQPPRAYYRADSFKPLDGSAEARKTVEVLREFLRASYNILKDHPINRDRAAKGLPPANAVVPWGLGLKPKLDPLLDKFGVRGACVAAVSLIKGVCKLAGMSVIGVPGATGDLNTNTLAKAEAALKALKSNELVLVHVEAPDEASHDGDIQGKIRSIRKIDSMVGLILENINMDEVCVTLMADHTTSTRLRMHTADPTPISIANSDVVPDGVSSYSERAAYRGGLGCLTGRDVMPTLLNIVGKSVRFGA